jgi:hypothetical protein
MASRTFGDPETPIQADFLSALAKINRREFQVCPISLGETETIGGTKLEVLWPPRRIAREETVKDVETAIEKFDDAAESDPYLNEHLEFIENRQLVSQYYQREEEFSVQPKEVTQSERDGTGSKQLDRDLPPEVEEANDAIKDAANHLSLAFNVGNRLLCFGDQESRELPDIISELKQNGYARFQLMKTPHHGTHWNSALSDIHTRLAVSSVGSLEYLKSEFKSICDSHWVTYLNGDLRFPPYNFADPSIPLRRYFPPPI